MEKLVSDKNVAHLWGKVKEYCDNKTNAGSHKHDDLYYPKDGVTDEFDSTKTYAVGEYCIYENKLYKCTTAITTGENFNSAKWEATTIGNVIAEIEKEVNELNSTTQKMVYDGEYVFHPIFSSQIHYGTHRSWILLMNANAYNVSIVEVSYGNEYENDITTACSIGTSLTEIILTCSNTQVLGKDVYAKLKITPK